MALVRPRTPAETWMLTETSLEPDQAARFETLFSLGNGNLGLRGNFEEGYPSGVPGTYLNGFYDETPIVYGEVAFGYARNRQVMLNVADGKPIRLSIGGEPFDLSVGSVQAYERTLDMAEGVMRRTVRWRSPGGRTVEVTSRRVVSLVEAHTAAIDWEARLLGGTGRLVVESSIDGTVENRAAGLDPRVGSRFPHRPLSVVRREAEGTAGLMVQRTRSTRFEVACAMEHVLGEEARIRTSRDRVAAPPDRTTVVIETARPRGDRLRFTKYLAYCSSREPTPGPVGQRAQEAVRRAALRGFGPLLAEHRQALDRFWHAADVQIEGDLDLQQSLRFNLFSLLQSAGRDGRTSIAAKGLSGEGYEGHYFWDAEIYALPFFVYTQPDIARALLRFRCGTLDAARQRAREMSQEGALFPWRTIGGEETSPYYPAGTAQYHIDADIAYALGKYLAATGDEGLLVDGGAELLFETARMWASLGWYNPRREGQFCINEVTGPDEYTALVNNNLYTNLMARENLELAARTAEGLRLQDPSAFERVARSIGLRDGEEQGWRRAAAAMQIPFDAVEGIHLQDDAFLDRPTWDLGATPSERFPLMLHYHPLVIYRHQALKQPDVVLAQVLLPHRFSLAEKKRNFDFYDARTTGDSSLAPCVQCVAAAELGYRDKAFSYFSRTARMDLDDVNGNVADGLHIAAMAGSWLAVVYGFAGMRELPRDRPVADCRLSFAPELPPGWTAVSFRLRLCGSLLQVSLSPEAARYLVREGGPLAVLHWGRRIELPPGQEVAAPMAPPLQAVIFDLDGVLTDTAELHYRAWKELCDEAEIPFDRAVNEELRGIGRWESLQIILRRAGVSMSGEEARTLAARKNDRYRELILGLTPADLAPGVPALLARLHRSGVKIALASASRNAPAIIERLGIRGSLDAVVDPGSLVKGKPDPEIFFRASEALGLPPRACAAVEDARAGILAIRSAGMFSVGIGRGLTEADWTLAEMTDLTTEELCARFEAWTASRTGRPQS